jgi:hypothetical protein
MTVVKGFALSQFRARSATYLQIRFPQIEGTLFDEESWTMHMLTHDEGCSFSFLVEDRSRCGCFFAIETGGLLRNYDNDEDIVRAVTAQFSIQKALLWLFAFPFDCVALHGEALPAGDVLAICRNVTHHF